VPHKTSLQPSANSLFRQVASVALDAQCTEHEAITLLRSSLLQESLERTGGNICHAALMLGKHRNRVAQVLGELQLRDLPREIRQSRQSKGQQLPLPGVARKHAPRRQDLPTRIRNAA
jgi:hypothetical protein